MKKTAIAIVVTIAVAVAVAGFATVAQATPKDNTWYAGGKLGWSQFHDSNWYDQLLNNDGPTHKNHLGVSSFGGYQVNPYIGFEMSYDWLGRILYKGKSINGAFKAQGIQLTAKLDYQAIKDLDLYTRFGGMIWRADSYHNRFGYDRDFGVSPVFAGGLEWAITRDIATRLEYQWINNIGRGDTIGVRPDNSMLSVGLSYRFSQQEKENPTIIASTLATKANTDNFTLKSDVLFNFNQSTLNPQDQQILDQFHNQLISMDPKEGTILVTGYTDRIGSDSYNQSLSEKRASYVADYLNSKGLQMIKISMHGMGKSNPVTGNNCDDKKVRSTLINCLAPDRRVEIEFKGIKNAIVKPAVIK